MAPLSSLAHCSLSHPAGGGPRSPDPDPAQLDSRVEGARTGAPDSQPIRPLPKLATVNQAPRLAHPAG